jgi:hypothetical protein
VPRIRNSLPHSPKPTDVIENRTGNYVLDVLKRISQRWHTDSRNRCDLMPIIDSIPHKQLKVLESILKELKALRKDLKK